MPDYTPFQLPTNFNFSQPDRDPDTVWPPDRRQVLQDPNNPESSVIIDWRYADAKQKWSALHPFVPEPTPDPIDRTKQPTVIQEYIRENGFDGGLTAYAASQGLVLVNGVYGPATTKEQALAALKVLQSYLQ